MPQPSGSAPPSAPSVAQPAARSLVSPVAVLRGVGPERAAQLARLGIHTIGDLLLHAPRRHEDRRKFITIRELELGKSATVFGKIVAAGLKTYRGGVRSVFEFVLEDGSARLHCRWWNLPFLERLFAVGDEVMVFGKPNLLKPRTMDHPETEKVEGGEDVTVHLNRIAPIYPLTEGLPQRVVRGLVWRAVEEFAGQVAEPHPELALTGVRTRAAVDAARGQLGLEERPLPTRADALRALHFPAELADADRARQRLALDEFVELQLEIQRRRQNLERNARAFPCAGDNRLMKPFLAALGFPLTGAQVRVLRELRADLAGPVPMRRLLQGDVGSGKTVVAAGAALMALESGCNVALMAPTEILAEQLHRNFARWLEPLGIAVELRTGSHKGSAAAVRAASVQLAEHGPEQGGFRQMDSGGTLEAAAETEASSLPGDNPFFERDALVERYHGWLPHWRQADKLYFVTFRLADSVAQPVLRCWQREKKTWEEAHPRPWSDDDHAEYHRRFSARIERFLDAGAGECWLRRPAVAELVEEALRHFDGSRYQLGEFVVMPNHVHALVRPDGPHHLQEIMHSWKAFTALRANALLGRDGPFWREEYFDHLVRSERQLGWLRAYIRDNPVKGHLAAGQFRLGRGGFEWPGLAQLRAASVQLAEPLRAGSRNHQMGSGGTLIVGTHALLEDSVALDRLGLVIIDEQHKFGVAQREQLLRKGREGREGGRFPHLLVMTATPIPRTLGLTLYGDLDVSVLDQVPAGRGRIRTHVRDAAALPKVWQFLRAELDKGRQAYVVYPRVSESDHDEVKAVTKEFARVQKELAPHRVALLHGQLRSEEKELVMAAFRAGTVQALVATSVIEVGVDVPNATVMLIEDAEQFGLAQLHQLRGRIGRGAHESHCILVAEQKTDAAKLRLKVLAETTDGFELAEADLRLRGPGELIGRQQSGLPAFRFGDLRDDRTLVELARELVRTHLRAKR